ncbi:MAG: class I adenylate cyclase [Pseudomonadota bacterium]
MEDLVKAFDSKTFETTWEKLSEEQKSYMIEKSIQLDPNIAILPVLAGIISYHFNVRNQARIALDKIKSSMRKLLTDSQDKLEYEKGLMLSESICARIYAQISPDMQLKEMSFFIKILLEFEGKGACFAFNALYNGTISVAAMLKIMGIVSEAAKLAFVDQYLQATAGTRLKFGRMFRNILKSIKDRDAVILFYASLFDRQRDADPFLNNINTELRDPKLIFSTELQSQSPEIKIMGLKALSMIVNEISPDFLLDMLVTEEVLKVRIAIYSIVENSTMGCYATLFYPILELFYKSSKKEALCIFKALVVTGKLPLYTLLEMVRENYPTLMPDILIEISSLSKISFFVIQDIALNKEKYLHLNFDINLACVLGMIKKRPERVVKILKNYDDVSEDHLRMNVIQFVEKTKQLMSKEKKDIESEFHPFIQQVKRASDDFKGVLSSFFTSPTEKKISILKTNAVSGSIDFEQGLIKNIDLSGTAFNSSPLYFNGSIIHNCDFSSSSLFRSFFKNAIFYNVNMDNSRFDSANFDHAVLINVSAKSAVFKHCSFQNTAFFNCNFNDASIQDASFLNATISKTSFNQANLFCSSFAFSRISAVSFVTTNIDQADFSYVKARFCRFPSNSRTLIRKDNIEFNNRKFQLSFSDMPQMDTAIIKDIDILTFSEFIHYGEAKFLKQNQLSLLTAFDIFKVKQADFFQIIPLLLHTNIQFPGLKKIDPLTPAGISDYTPSRESIEIIKKYIKFGNNDLLNSQTPLIEGLFTIGSVGSVAQTSDSDIDYWVCINEKQYTIQDLDRLDQKLRWVEQMAAEQFETQVTFFRVDILKARDNDFGGSSIESSGSAQTRILKEEFYRTMIHVAGKIPLWAVLPTAISLQYYNTILNYTGNMPNLSRYIDLGDIHAISTSEFFGASIWQMFKWLKSPFKSVIKMALLEKYIYGYGKEALLCNKYKDEWMNSGAHLKLAQNDSYYILLKDLLLYYENIKDSESVSLLLTCFFLKLEISKEAEIDNTVFGLRKFLLDKCMRKWGWDKERIFEVGNYKAWQYSQIVKLSMTIKKYMVKKYKTVNKVFESMFHGRSQISPEDRTVLGRKIFIEFSKQPWKVEKVLLVSRSDRHFQGVNLRYLNPTNTIGFWELFNKNAKALFHHEEQLIKAKTIEEIGAWLINNSLYNENAVINLVPNPTYVTFDDIRKLYSAMNEFFAPNLNQVVSFDQLLMKSRVVSLFISLNFYAPRQQSKITEYTIIYLNSWGEMFCQSVYKKQGFDNMDATKQDIVHRIGINVLPKNTAFYFSKGLAR